MFDLDFYKNRNVFVTGHTGFKGTWLCRILTNAGANVTGYSLDPPTNPSLFALTDMKSHVRSVTGDVRDYDSLKKAFDESNPGIVFHLAAQPLVRESYQNPVYTFDTNVMGTVNVLECIRKSNTVRSFLNVTTDKVYSNKELSRGYREGDELCGHDPYSNSKSCSELVTHSYRRSFFADSDIAISTARAGNAIGGGDFAKDRIIPDCVRAALNGLSIVVRNPYSTRPYQHVLEPLFVYLMIAAKQFEDKRYQGSYNVGPDDRDCIQTGELVDLFIRHWGCAVKRVDLCDNGPHEADFLKLDCSLLKNTFGWTPVWDINKAVQNVIDWSKCYQRGDSLLECMDSQIEDFSNKFMI